MSLSYTLRHKGDCVYVPRKCPLQDGQGLQVIQKKGDICHD